jgi:hypothetical protein
MRFQTRFCDYCRIEKGGLGWNYRDYVEERRDETRVSWS